MRTVPRECQTAAAKLKYQSGAGAGEVALGWEIGSKLKKQQGQLLHLSFPSLPPKFQQEARDNRNGAATITKFAAANFLTALH